MATVVRSLRASLLLAGIMLLLVVGAITLVVRVFVQEETGPPVTTTKLAADEKDFVRVEVFLLACDQVRGRMEVELNFIPRGRFDAGGGLLAVPLEVDVSSVGGEPLELAADRKIFPREVTLSFLDGSAADYPFDIHHVQLQLQVLAHTDEKGGREKVPVEFVIDPYYQGLAIGVVPQNSPKTGYVGVELELRRSRLLIVTVGFCMAIMWALTIINLLMLWAVLTRRIEVDLELFAYMSGMIVALYFFRQVLPEVPLYIGVLADYLSFFWAELITAGCAVVFAIIWYRRLLKSAPGETIPPWTG